MVVTKEAETSLSAGGLQVLLTACSGDLGRGVIYDAGRRCTFANSPSALPLPLGRKVYHFLSLMSP